MMPSRKRPRRLAMPDKATVDALHCVHAVSPLQRRLSDAQLAEAMDALRVAGYVTLDGVVAPEHLDALQKTMADDLERLTTEPALANVPSNYVRGHLQQAPPPCHPHVYSDIVANPAVEQLIAAVLGERAFLSLYSGNTNLPGSEQQPTHADVGHGTSSHERDHPRTMCVNIPLVETTEANGSIELWPGTHLDPRLPVSDRHHQFGAADQYVKARTLQVPPVRGNTRKGSILVRDPRLWHRGTTNRSATARMMLTLMYEAEGVDVSEPRCAAPRFRRCCRAAFAGSTLTANVEFSDDDDEGTL